MRYGCIGKKLVHSFSREIHSRLADYEYELIELSEEELSAFFEGKDFAAINVTIPYKETVIPYLDGVSDIARRIGAVNTIVNREGKLYGYNTDYYGMRALMERVGLSPMGKKVLILGTGGTSKTAHAVLTDMGAAQILTVSRGKRDDFITYDEAVSLHSDAHIIINTTPVGMYPEFDVSPIDITAFTRLEGVIDAVYNPLRTDLVSEALARGIKAEGGLYMLVMQAVRAVEIFLDTEIDPERAERAYADIMGTKENIVLIGMPGCGKSTVGKLLDIDGYELIDTDSEIERRCGCAIAELIRQRGESCFRGLEREIIAEASSKGGRIISTGGGAILRGENVRTLKRNGRLFFIDAPLSALGATVDRPLSDTEDKLAKLYAERIDIYRAVADVTVPYSTPECEAEYIKTKRTEQIK